MALSVAALDFSPSLTSPFPSPIRWCISAVTAGLV